MWMAGGVNAEDRLDAAGSRRVARRTAARLGNQRRALAVTAGAIAANVVATLAGPWAVRLAIDGGLGAGSGDSTILWFAVGAYLASAVAVYVVTRWVIRSVNTIGERFLRDLRVDLFAHLQRQPLAFYDRTRSGVIVARMTADVDSMQELVQLGLLMLTQNVLLLGLAVVILALASWPLLLLCLVVVPPIVVASLRFKTQSNDAYLAVRDQIGAVLSRLQEGVTGVRVIQAHGQEAVVGARFDQANDELLGAHMRAVRAQAWYLPVIEGSGVATTALAVGAGGWMVLSGQTTVGTVAFFVLTLANLFEPISQLSQLFNVVQSAGAALDKVYGLLDLRPEVDERPGAVDLPAAGPLELAGVGFAYPGRPAVLAGVDLVVQPGERVALVGPTGAGKSTLAKLVARLADPSEGTVRFAGVDLRRASLASLRERIVLVPQEGFLFAGTVRDNVAVARPELGEAAVRGALARLGVLKRFAELEAGLDTEVRERGGRFSAGERQLVSLARAAMIDPAVLILDEATSNLDPGTEAAVEAAVERLSEDRTVLVIAHRLSTAARADRVAVVDGGRLVEVGTHEELVGRGGRYAQLFAAWLAGVP
jgi:ATP-binding cassette subfamily B protein